MISAIPISKGVFKTEHTTALANNEFAEDLVNMMIGPAGENIDRPSLVQITTLGSSEIIGAYSFNGLSVFVTSDRRVHAMTSAGLVVDVTGTILGGSARPTFVDDGSVLYIAGGAEPLKWEGLGNVTEVLGGSPPNMTHIAYLDGYIIGNRRNNSENNKVIQWSEYEDPETWTGTDIFSAVADPDPVSGIAVAQRELHVVGEKTTEVWQNVGAYPVPFARAFIWQYGTTAPYSIISADNSIMFLDRDRKILRFSGRQMSYLSEAIAQELSGYETTDDCWSASFSWLGKIHVLFVFPTEEKAWSVDLSNGQWSEWRGWDGEWCRPSIGAVCYSDASGDVYAGDYASNKIFKMSSSVKVDAGGTFKRLRRCSWRDAGASVRKISNFVRVRMNRRVASNYVGDLPDTNPTIELRWRDEGGPWSNPRQASIGMVGEKRGYVEFRRLGIYRNRQYEFTISDPAEFVITGIETDEEVMAS